jgi:hypothetical protein
VGPFYTIISTRSQQVIRGAHRKQEYGRKSHYREAGNADPTHTASTYEVNTQNGKDNRSQQMSGAIHWFSEAWNGVHIDVVPLEPFGLTGIHEAALFGTRRTISDWSGG